MLLVLNSSPNQEKVFPITNLMVMKIDIKCASIFFPFLLVKLFISTITLHFLKIHLNLSFFKKSVQKL